MVITDHTHLILGSFLIFRGSRPILLENQLFFFLHFTGEGGGADSYYFGHILVTLICQVNVENLSDIRVSEN